MSESVWYEQVDTALVKLITDNIKVGGKPVLCRVRKPDEDFKKEEYPLVSLYSVFSKRDDFRRCPEPVPVSYDLENHTRIVEQPCLPYNLFYQIDFWTQKQSQMNEMTMQWLLLTDGGRDFNLDVIDTGGNPRSCYCMCTDDFRKSDLVDGNSRTFHSFITYRIYVEIDENIQSEESVVISTQVATKPDNLGGANNDG